MMMRKCDMRCAFKEPAFSSDVAAAPTVTGKHRARRRGLVSERRVVSPRLRLERERCLFRREAAASLAASS